MPFLKLKFRICLRQMFGNRDRLKMEDLNKVAIIENYTMFLKTALK